ncbi:MAG: 5'-nucleotidase C-terminal domain-containing protein, partial [Paracoccaceae bacterium]
GGPENFTEVPAGPLLMRNAADLYVHPNRFAAVAIDGAGLRDWLERAAAVYRQIEPGKADQPLLDPMHPATCLEMVSGVTYQIDLSAPARFSSPVGVATGQVGRIAELRYLGQIVTDDMVFALATNSYRVGVLTSLAKATVPEVIADGTGTLGSRDVLLRHLARAHQAPSPAPLGWSLRAMPGTSVVVDTSPAATAYLGDIARFKPDPLGLTDEGFLRFRLHL